MKKDYKETHLKTFRYKCKKINNGFPVVKNGNYESLASFKALPPFKEFKEKGRRWEYTKEYKPIMDRIVLDIDCEDLNIAYDVANAVMNDLAEYSNCINVYFSGSKGFHIEILTAELDIIDTSAKQPKDSCFQYEEFLNYWNSRYNVVDTSLKDVGVRVIRIHHTRHEKTGNYKVLADITASLDDIIESSKKNEDMTSLKTDYLSKEKALHLLNKYSKPVERKSKSSNADITITNTDNSIFTAVYNDLKTNIHTKIGLIGSGLNGYVDYNEMLEIYRQLAETTNIEESDNAEGSFIDAYENDTKPCNLGALRNHYKNFEVNLSNFNKLSMYLDSKVQLKGYDEFNNIIESYNYNWYNMLDEKMYDYVDNTINIFKGIINSLSALYGYGSRFIVVNGGAEVGKSEYVNTIKKLMPKFKNLGSSTPASIRRQSEYEFDKKIVYLGDKGLKGKDDEEFKGLQEVFGGLITEGEFIRDIVIGDKLMNFNLVSEGICVFYTEPYTNLRVFGAGDQYTTRSTFITVNPVEDGLAVFLQDNAEENEFYAIHRNYIKYILKNPIEVVLSNEVKTELYYASRNSLRTAKYLLGLFKAYCQYVQIKNPLASDVEEFLKVFKHKAEITQIEYMVYEKLYKNLNVLSEDDLSYKIVADDEDSEIRRPYGSVHYDDLLMQTKNRKDKSFFTAKQIKTYFRNDFKRNKNLKDIIDQIPDILNNLYNANYIERIDWQYNGQNVYYIPQNEDMA